MSQLLISVKNVEEALITLQAGVDLIDLKDPEIGALGALDLQTSEQILQAVQQYKQLNPAQYFPLTSATVGENPGDFFSLQKAVKSRMEMGIDIIKIAAPDVFCYFDEIKAKLDLQQIKLIAVFFAEQSLDLNLLQKLKSIGFYGAMLDTQKKQQNLLKMCTLPYLQKFIETCQKIDLISGLAGSLKPQHVEQLVDINPSYIGFRGGVCTDDCRVNTLIEPKIVQIKEMLQEHNRISA